MQGMALLMSGCFQDQHCRHERGSRASAVYWQPQICLPQPNLTGLESLSQTTGCTKKHTNAASHRATHLIHHRQRERPWPPRVLHVAGDIILPEEAGKGGDEIIALREPRWNCLVLSAE